MHFRYVVWVVRSKRLRWEDNEECIGNRKRRKEFKSEYVKARDLLRLTDIDERTLLRLILKKLKVRCSLDSTGLKLGPVADSFGKKQINIWLARMWGEP